jgi:hypothetical protein
MSSRPLRIYVPRSSADRHWWPTLLEPLSEALAQAAPSQYQRRVAGSWSSEGRKHLQLAEASEADVAVLPFGIEASVEVPRLAAEAVRLAADAASSGLLMLVFCHGDVEVPAPGPNCLVLRNSRARSDLAPQDVPLPAWVEDPSDSVQIRPRAWHSRPIVNFVGQAYPLGVNFPSRRDAMTKWIKAGARGMLTAANLADRFGVPRYQAQRAAAVIALRLARRVEGHVVLRSQPTRLDMGRTDDQDRHREMIEAITTSDYTLAPRGYGNYSFRLYESLACGRPAVLIESGMAFPCSTDCHWETIAVTLRRHQLARLGTHLHRRHSRIRPQWEAIQMRCRSEWERHLSATGFLSRLVRCLTDCLDAGITDPTSMAQKLR